MYMFVNFLEEDFILNNLELIVVFFSNVFGLIGDNDVLDFL